MSQESSQWLNQNVLIGQTAKRGSAWHYRASDQGDEPNHYPGFIPVEDLKRRLFGFEPVEAKAAYLVGPIPSGEVDEFVNRYTVIDGEWYQITIDPDHKAIIPSDGDQIVFGYHGKDYVPHSYGKWLVDNVSTLLDADLGVTSAGLLRRRAQAWVEVSVEDVVHTPEGFPFRPNLLAFTSLDQSLATTYKRTVNAVVCDNTLALRVFEPGETVRIKHTAGSELRIAEAREVLSLLYKTADEFAAEIKRLCEVQVTEQQWQDVLGALFPVPEEEGRAKTFRQNRHDKLDDLYHAHEWVSPWQGTAFGVVQCVNTYFQHHKTVRTSNGGGRVERNLINTLGTQIERLDRQVLDALDLVLAAA
jgi:phage/plasmid-like protein (TIGR03299 family)